MPGMLTLGRIIMAVLVLWFAVGLVSFVFFASGGTAPPARGEGTEVERPR
jgi:hypothetical protein